MNRCTCGSYAINPDHHGRQGDHLDLCDVCYWRARHDALAAEREALTKLTSDLLAENAGLRDKADRLAVDLADITMVELAALKGE